jgi:hypothetical protein
MTDQRSQPFKAGLTAFGLLQQLSNQLNRPQQNILGDNNNNNIYSNENCVNNNTNDLNDPLNALPQQYQLQFSQVDQVTQSNEQPQNQEFQTQQGFDQFNTQYQLQYENDRDYNTSRHFQLQPKQLNQQTWNQSQINFVNRVNNTDCFNQDQAQPLLSHSLSKNPSNLQPVMCSIDNGAIAAGHFEAPSNLPFGANLSTNGNSSVLLPLGSIPLQNSYQSNHSKNKALNNTNRPYSGTNNQSSLIPNNSSNDSNNNNSFNPILPPSIIIQQRVPQSSFLFPLQNHNSNPNSSLHNDSDDIDNTLIIQHSE